MTLMENALICQIVSHRVTLRIRNAASPLLKAVLNRFIIFHRDVTRTGNYHAKDKRHERH